MIWKHAFCRLNSSGGRHSLLRRTRAALHRPGEPRRNGFVESFDRRLRAGRPNEVVFALLAGARAVIERRRLDDNPAPSHVPQHAPRVLGDEAFQTGRRGKGTPGRTFAAISKLQQRPLYQPGRRGANPKCSETALKTEAELASFHPEDRDDQGANSSTPPSK
ncbi:transposase [Roseiarcus fermentans]|uniref:transposase n=1 Tax=Roseiarcus fermentans TaxID=1473586 RepID=UPI0011BDEACB|nr:transposase [Roseiarcus fermentans]